MQKTIKQHLKIVPLKFNSRDFLKEIGMYLQDILPVSCAVGDPLPVPHQAFHTERAQFNSTAVLNAVYPSIKSPGMVLVVADSDLYSSGLNFVFGEADIRRGIAIISLARLHQSFYGLKENPELLFTRTLKEAVHETGHLFRMGHCTNHRCVMHFSNSLSDTDTKDFRFCSNCSKYFQM
ncbi:MAG: archaemetzincin family Zn-dependent metalloprotease [Spirochaetota bacterium]